MKVTGKFLLLGWVRCQCLRDLRKRIVAPACTCVCARCAGRGLFSLQGGVRERIRQGHPRRVRTAHEDGDAPAPGSRSDHRDHQESGRAHYGT